MIEPELRFTPPLNVLPVLEKTTEPVPPTLIGPLELTIGAEIKRLLVDRPEVLIVAAELLKARLPPVICGVMAVLSFWAVTALEALSVSRPPLMFNEVWLVPPMPAKPTLLSTLPPIRVRRPPPPSVTLLVGAIWPALLFIATVPPLICKLPGTWTPPTWPLRFNVPWLTNVVPE